MPAEFCGDRISLSSQVFACREPRVFTRNGVVDSAVCRECSFRKEIALGKNRLPFSVTASFDSKRLPRLFVVPAESLRRDPSGWHKTAYVRLLASAFDAELVLVEDEDRVVHDVERLRPELVLTMNFPWYRRFSDSLFWSLPKQLPIVTVHDDCRRQMHPRLEAVLERSAAVISPVRSPVLDHKQFPGLAGKLHWLPYFIPSGVSALPLNERPQLKCLVTGAVNEHYPVRQQACRSISPSHLQLLPHPGYWKMDYSDAITGARYLELIHQYVAAVTCGSVYRCVVMKYLEIAYSGALLIAEDVPDLDEMGFSPNDTFIAVNEKSAFAELVRQIVTQPEIFVEIRRRAQQLAYVRHTEVARTVEAESVARTVLQSIGLRCATEARQYREFARNG